MPAARAALRSKVELRLLDQHFAHLVVDIEQLEDAGAALEAEAAAFLARLFDFFRLGTRYRASTLPAGMPSFFSRSGVGA